MTTERDAERRRRLRAMQRIALALLAAMAALFLLAHSQRASHDAWGYVAAFAEASMIGALADWFAVVALFRHPMGVPIWHTAIVPTRKDDIARHLGEFVESHFVSAEAVLARLRGFDPAGRVATWLQQPPNSQALGRWAGTAARQLLAQFDDSRLRAALDRRLLQTLSTVDPLPFAARWADELVAERRHQQGLDWALRRVIAWLESDAAKPSIAQVLDTVDHLLVSTLSGRIAAIVRNGSLRLCKAALAEPDHVLRQRFEGLVGQGLTRLHGDAQWAATVQRFQHDLLASERLQHGLNALWDDLKGALLDDLGQPEPRLGISVAGWLAELGRWLGTDAAARAWINDTLCQAARPLVVSNRGKVAAYIQAQIDAWSKEEMTDRIELAIGRDLQFIRINGTVVGGLVGLVLYALTRHL
ncbi:MAG: DUF445 domain-containing protein [Burkholderiales bacterium]